jgi:hypothetical protein
MLLQDLENKRHDQKCSSSGEAGSQPRDSTNAPLTKSEARERRPQPEKAAREKETVAVEDLEAVLD